MSDLISRLSEIRSNYNCIDETDEPYYRALSEAIQLASVQPDTDAIHLQKEQAYTQGWEDGRASIVQPSLYGYDIAHLAVIAAVMEKEGVTPEKAVQIFGDIQAACQMVVDELQERVAKAISLAQPEDCDTCIHGYFGDSQCDNCRVRYPSHYERRTDETD